MTSCDVRTERLFPVQRLDGTCDMVGLRELLLSAHEIADLGMTIPPAAAGMLRILYTIVARVTGLDTADEASIWAGQRNKVLSRGRLEVDEVDQYLGRDNSRWDLFDDRRPWLQDPRLVEQAELKSVNALDMTRPGDNSPIWWSHTHAGHAPPIPTHLALQWLLAHLYYGSGGAGGVRKIDGQGDQYMSAGPLRSTVTFYPWGDNLFETLIAGIPSPQGLDPHATDVACWETGTSHDPFGVPPIATWPAGVLTGQFRHALLLVPDASATAVTGCYLTWAWKARHPPQHDPYTIVERRANGTEGPRAASASRAVWRDLDALLGGDHADPNNRRPEVLSAALNLPDELRDRLRVRAIGFDQDRKATNEAWYTATTPPVIRYMDNHYLAYAIGAHRMRVAAEEIAGVMTTALRTAYRSLSTGSAGKSQPARDVPWIAPAAHHYWPLAEARFWRSLADKQFDEPHRAYLRDALDAVDTATRHEAHVPNVARQLASVNSCLHRFAAKKDPRSTDNASDGKDASP